MIGECLRECGTYRASGPSPAMGSSVRSMIMIFFASQSVHDCGFWEGSDDVEMDGSNFYATGSLDMVDVRFDIFRCRFQ